MLAFLLKTTFNDLEMKVDTLSFAIYCHLVFMLFGRISLYFEAVYMFRH